jgi:hypothetical protein
VQTNTDIYAKFANTSSAMYRLTTNISVDDFPGFSPDGRKFTFRSDRVTPQVPNATTDVWAQNLIVDTSTYANPQNETQDPSAQDSNPDWQPKGGMCPTNPGGGGASQLPPLPVDPTYPLSPTDVQSGTGASGGAHDNDPGGGGSSDGGHTGNGDSSQGGTGNPCPGGGTGSSDGGNVQTGSHGS